MRQSGETMTSVSAGHIIQTPTPPVGSGRPERESNPESPHQKSRALPPLPAERQGRDREREIGIKMQRGREREIGGK